MGSEQTCPVCGWEYDRVNPVRGGSSHMSTGTGVICYLEGEGDRAAPGQILAYHHANPRAGL